MEGRERERGMGPTERKGGREVKERNTNRQIDREGVGGGGGERNRQTDRDREKERERERRGICKGEREAGRR